MRNQNRKSRESGQVMIMITLALVPMFGAIGMVTDLGYMEFVKESAQTAAEVAARSAIINFHATVGGAVLTCTTTGVVCATSTTSCPTNIVSPTNSIQVGCMYAKQHGFQATGTQNVTYVTGGTGLTGTQTTPPTAAGIKNVQFWVTYAVAQKVPQMFSSLLGDPQFQNGLVASRSTAAVVGSSDCIYALNQTAANAVSVAGTAELASSCGIYDNSNSSTALSCNGHGSSYAYDAPEFDVVGTAACGSYDPSGSTSPNTGVSVTSDPLASLPVPSTAPYTCAYTNTTLNASSASTVIDISPGVYCGGIAVKKGIATFASGTYTIVGGGLSTQDANSTIDASAGVFIYNTLGSGSSHTYSYGPIAIAATSTVTMKALTTGTYAGILFFEDRSAPANSDTYGGGSTAVYQGVIYAKNAAVTMYGNSSINTAYTMLVADTISLVGTTTFNDNYSSLPNGSPIMQVSVVE